MANGIMSTYRVGSMEGQDVLKYMEDLICHRYLDTHTLQSPEQLFYEFCQNLIP